ncbi:MAG: inorganic diphosphatase [Candidatus Dojkabacteria bacterium]|nr:MAG: inorganic diphosphatase [Candidatus Dojkabacteria bacterium]
MLVEIPQGSFNKYEYVTEAGIIKLDRVLYEMLPYPVEYGLIPQTWDEDEDMLDVIALMTYPTFPGCLIAGRIIGIMYMNDSGEKDSKIVVVPADDARFDHIQTVDDIPRLRRDEIQYFFEHYKDLQFKYKGKTDKKIVIEGWGGIEEAHKVLSACTEEYKKKFTSNT